MDTQCEVEPTAKNPEVDLRVEAESYVSNYKFISEGFVYFDRTHEYKSPVSDIDVFGQFWGLAICNFLPGQIGIHRQGKTIPLVGPLSIWMPPGSLVDWRLEKGTIHWSSYLSSAPLPRDLPRDPITIFGQPEKLFENSTELFDFLRGAKPGFPVSKIEQSNPLALRLKERIDQNFTSEKSLLEMAQELKVTHSAMTRAFRRSFDISPVAYRTRLRVFEAMKLLLLEGRRSNETCHRVGFLDISRFNKQFRSLMRSIPSQYNGQKSKGSGQNELGESSISE